MSKIASVRPQVTDPSEVAAARRRAAPTRAEGASRGGAQTVKPQRTPLAPGRIRVALERAYEAKHGSKPSAAMLDVLTAHVSHETADGNKMYNHNFGGIKGVSPDGFTARLRTTEVIRGRSIRIRDGFRAYETPERGAADYLGYLERNHPQALERASRGDVSGFARSLKSRGYYTASLRDYQASMARRMEGAEGWRGWVSDGRLDEAVRSMQVVEGGRYTYGEELAAEARALDGEADETSTEVDVARVFSAVQGMAARIGAPVDEDEA